MRKLLIGLLAIASFSSFSQVFDGELLKETTIDVSSPALANQLGLGFVQLDIRDSSVAKKIYIQLGTLIGTKAEQILVQTDGSIMQRHLLDGSIRCIENTTKNNYICFVEAGL